MVRQHQGMDRPGVRQVPEGSGEQGKMEKTGCKVICGAPTTLAVKGLMMMKRRRLNKRDPFVALGSLQSGPSFLHQCFSTVRLVFGEIK